MSIKWKCKAILSLLFGLIVSIAVLWFTSQNTERAVMASVTDPALKQAFYATGADLEHVYVSAWVYLGPQDHTPEELKQIAEQTSAVLAGSAANVKVHTSAGVCSKEVQAVAETATRNITVTAQVLHPGEKYEDQAKTYLTVDIEEKGESVDIGELENKVMTVIREKGNPFSITTCLSGWVSGKLEEEKMIQAIRQAFQRVRARTEEGISSPHFVSYAGMTDSIDRAVTVRKKVINLNIAMRHHSTEDRTYVTVASPVITREY
jgi:hypothetical protein